MLIGGLMPFSTEVFFQVHDCSVNCSIYSYAPLILVLIDAKLVIVIKGQEEILLIYLSRNDNAIPRHAMQHTTYHIEMIHESPTSENYY